MGITFRPLRADEIDCRISMVKENGLCLLLYKDARVDQNILDETFGVMGWQRSHQLIGDRLYCTISVWDADKQMWVSKQDVGTESYTEKEKGQASDSFKRAAFNFGIGRELYTAPFIWVAKDECSITRRQNGKLACDDRFSVKDITIENGKITALTIRNDARGTIAYRTDKPASPAPKSAEKKPEQEGVPKVTAAHVSAIMAELNRTGVPAETIARAYHVDKLEDMDMIQFSKCMKRLEITKNKISA